MSERLGSMYWMAICILSLLITTNAAAITIQSVRVIYNGDTDTPLFVKNGDHIEIVVTVKGADEKALVGATIIDPEGDELDLPFQYVHCAKNLIGGPTTSNVTLSTTITEEMDAGLLNGNGLRLVVKLWGDRVTKSACDRVDPSDGNPPCSYCRKNGYHMVGQIGDAKQLALPGYLVGLDEFEW